MFFTQVFAVRASAFLILHPTGVVESQDVTQLVEKDAHELGARSSRCDFDFLEQGYALCIDPLREREGCGTGWDRPRLKVNFYVLRGWLSAWVPRSGNGKRAFPIVFQESEKFGSINFVCIEVPRTDRCFQSV